MHARVRPGHARLQARPCREGQRTHLRRTDTPAEEGSIVWTPDSDGIVYASSVRIGGDQNGHHAHG